MQFSSRTLESHFERDRSGNHSEQDQAILSRVIFKSSGWLGALDQLRNTPVIRTSDLKHSNGIFRRALIGYQPNHSLHIATSARRGKRLCHESWGRVTYQLP
jgi:hypothetical protein